MSVRTRFAPSPTGYLHIGGARTALFNWLFARKHGGEFILRIEDTDQERNTETARAAIFEGLEWLGIDWDEGPDKAQVSGLYYQSQRHEIYEKYFNILKEAGRVYEDEGAWRFQFERKPITVHDLVCGDVTIDYRDESNTPDMVVRRSDGSFVFHFVNVVDDLEMKLTHVIRGEDHLMNTPKHLQLFEAFGVKPPQYAHIPLILNENGSKMSKRDAGAAVNEYPKQGFLAEAVANFIALLGWSSKTDEEVFSTAELIERFSLENVNRAPSRFDIEKCGWMNQQHLAKLSDADFISEVRPFAVEAGLPTNDKFAAAVSSIKAKVRLFSEVPLAIDFLLSEKFTTDEAAIAKALNNKKAPLLPAIADAFAKLDDWSADTAKAAIGEVATANGAKMGQLMFPTRVALSRRASGPDLGDIFEILGKETVISRIREFSA